MVAILSQSVQFLIMHAKNGVHVEIWANGSQFDTGENALTAGLEALVRTIHILRDFTLSGIPGERMEGAHKRTCVWNKLFTASERVLSCTRAILLSHWPIYWTMHTLLPHTTAATDFGIKSTRWKIRMSSIIPALGVGAVLNCYRPQNPNGRR